LVSVSDAVKEAEAEADAAEFEAVKEAESTPVMITDKGGFRYVIICHETKFCGCSSERF